MKEILFRIIVILLIPVYIVIKILEKVTEWCVDVFGPVADGMYLLTENMLEFWSEVFKGEK